MSSREVKASGKVFRDPVHKLIRIDPDDVVLLELLDTPEMQRLRRIRQLGVSNLTFHGAEHSRFAHSLGVMNFAQRILESLKRRYKNDTEVLDYLNVDNCRIVKAAALLHDMGHRPFSHMLERAFDGGDKHEKMTVRIIRSNDTQVFKALKDCNVDPEKVAELIEGTSEHSLLKDIVSSQLDADRMDYLLRDSLATGVEYGRFDAEWLISALCIGRDPQSSNDGTQSWRLCLDKQRGLPSAEQFILARVHMTEQVYFHRATRGYEVLLLNLFQAAGRCEKSKTLPGGTPGVIREFFANNGNLDHDQWLRFDEAALTAAMHVWSGSNDELAELARAFLNRERKLVGVRIPRNFGLSQTAELASDLQSLGTRGVDWDFDSTEVAVYKGLLAGSTGLKDDEESSSESILLSDGNPRSKAKPCETDSLVLQKLDNVKNSLDRLYFDRSLSNKMEPILQKLGLEKG